MADDPISGFAALGGAPATNDLFVVVDVSDTTGAPTGTTKSATAANVFTSPTISAPTLTGATAVNGQLTLLTAVAAGTYAASFSGTAGGARDVLRAGVFTVANGFTVQYDGTNMVYTFTPGKLTFNANLAAPVLTPTVTGSRGGNAALGSLMTALASMGLVIDGTSA